MSLMSNYQIEIIFFVLGLSRNLFCIVQDITTIFGITRGGYCCKCGIYAQLIHIDIRINNKTFCGSGA